MMEPRSDSHSSMAQLFGQQVTFLNTSSLEDTADFYGTKLSLPLVFEQPGGGFSFSKTVGASSSPAAEHHGAWKSPLGFVIPN